MRHPRSGARLLGALVLAPLLACSHAAPASTNVGPPATATARVAAPHVLVVSVDGLNPSTVTADRTPNITRMMREGASTRNARTEVEQTETLPNHTGMVTSRRVAASAGGHGVTWNDERLTPRTVSAAAGHPVASVFSVLESNQMSAGLFVSIQKLSLFDRSWPAGVDRMVVNEDNHRLTGAFLGDVLGERRPFTFLHLSGPDVAGHAYGYLSPRYLSAVHRADAEIGRILAALDQHPGLAATTTLVVTSDHGGRGLSHKDATKLVNYRIPFVAWGNGVAHGDLYDLNPDYANPGTSRAWYGAPRQPVRNGDVANLSLDVLGLGPVPGSELNVAQDLDLR